MKNTLRTVTAAAAGAILTLGLAGPAAAEDDFVIGDGGGAIVITLPGPEFGTGTTLSVAEKKERALRELRTVAKRKHTVLENQAEALEKVSITRIRKWENVRLARLARQDHPRITATARSVTMKSTLTQIRKAVRYMRGYKPGNYATTAYAARNALAYAAEIKQLTPLVPIDETYSPNNRLDGLLGSAAAIHSRSSSTQLTTTRDKVAWVEEAMVKMRNAAAAANPTPEEGTDSTSTS